MGPHQLGKTSPIWLKGFDAIMRRFSICTHLEVYRNSVMETLIFSVFPSSAVSTSSFFYCHNSVLHNSRSDDTQLLTAAAWQTTTTVHNQSSSGACCKAMAASHAATAQTYVRSWSDAARVRLILASDAISTRPPIDWHSALLSIDHAAIDCKCKEFCGVPQGPLHWALRLNWLIDFAGILTNPKGGAKEKQPQPPHTKRCAVEM